jgi:molecular chaperone Hsp33
MNSRDRLIQGMAVGGDFRILAAQTTESVIEVTRRLDLSPVAATALGRAMTGAVMLARLLDKHFRNQKVVLRFEGSGPLGVVLAEGAVDGTMRGTVGDPHYDDPAIDVGSALGRDGLLTVIRKTPPDGRPYTTQVRLANGEIATDLTHYLGASEQISSAVLLGVMSRPGGISAAGGLIVQAFPHATEESIATIEEKIREAPPFSQLLDRMSIEDAVREIFGGVDYKQVDPRFDVPLRFECGCTRERAFAPFGMFDQPELQEMIDQGGADVTCQYCAEQYRFTAEELIALGQRNGG